MLKISDLIELETFPYSLNSKIGAIFARDAIRTLCAANTTLFDHEEKLLLCISYQISTMNCQVDHDCVLTL